MRIIWYMIDGLSAEKLASLNPNVEKINNKTTSKYSFFDEIIIKSLTFSRLYGTGETFASLASKLTGESLSKLKGDYWFHPNSFTSKNNISIFFKQNYKTSNIFYRNYSDKYPTDGVYSRFNKLCTFGFDKYILKDESRIELKDSMETSKFADYFALNSDKAYDNKFVFIHDLYLHDHPTAYNSTDIKDYEDAIVDAADHVKRNLEYLNFDEAADILILSSDHGLTINPDLQMFTNKLTTPEEYSQYKKSLYSELKLRSFLAIYTKGIRNEIINPPITMQNVYSIIRDIIPQLVEKNDVDIMKIKQQHCNQNVLISVADLTFGNASPLKLRQKFHSHIIYYKGESKWIYTRYPEKEAFYVDIKNPKIIKSITYDELPEYFKSYIIKYYSPLEYFRKSDWLRYHQLRKLLVTILRKVYRFSKNNIPLRLIILKKGILDFSNRYEGYQKELANFQINSTDKVLDVGSGHDPFPLATHLADFFDQETTHRSEKLKRDHRPFTKCSVESMPFKDKEFDFVYCSHVLEHVDNPAKACDELMRIAKRGYIETPTKISDVMLNFTKLENHHKWFVEIRGNNLIFIEWTKKERRELGEDDYFFKSLQSKWDNPFQKFFYKNRDLMINSLLWEKEFNYIVINKDGKIIAQK